MTTLTELMMQDCRRIMLEAMLRADNYQLNEKALKISLEYMAQPRGRDEVQAAAQWLERHGLVEISKLPLASGEMWVVRLTEQGAEVAQGRPHVGVARPWGG